MSSLSVLMTPSTTFTQNGSMTNATFNFLLDTLMHEIEMHPHRDELIQLIREQQETTIATPFEIDTDKSSLSVIR